MRTLAKTGTYFVMHLTVAVSVAYALSGDWAIALSIGILEPIVQAGFFALHERVWESRKRRTSLQLETSQFESSQPDAPAGVCPV